MAYFTVDDSAPRRRRIDPDRAKAKSDRCAAGPAPVRENDVGLKGVVVIDEIQRRPEIFPLLRVLADRKPLPARLLILASASPELLKQSSATLARRLETVPLEGFRVADLGADAQVRHWLRGGASVLHISLDALHVVYPGDARYSLAKGIDVVPLAQMVNAD